MKGKISGITVMIIMAAILSGCGSSIPEMTEEQNAQIVEYAAGLLLKYDENYDSRLVDTAAELSENTQDEGAEKEGGQPVEPGENAAAAGETEPAGGEETKAEENSGMQEAEASGVANRSIEEFYGIDGVEIRYAGYELKDVYSGSETEPQELSFAMTASSGCRLLVLNFDVSNTTEQDISMDMLSANAKFKISVNGEAPRYALTTMLTDDLSSFTGTIGAGTSLRLVLVAEIPEQQADSIQTVSLVMRNVSEEATTLLN